MKRVPAMNVTTENAAQASVIPRIVEYLSVGALMVTLGGLLWLGYKGYGWLDAVGVISHSRTVEVRLRGDWMVGETRTCNAWYVGDYVDGLNCMGSNDDAPWREGTSHTLSVKFWGKMHRVDSLAALRDPTHKGQWGCKRRSDALTCWAMN